MSNKAHNNNGLRTIVQQRRDGVMCFIRHTLILFVFFY